MWSHRACRADLRARLRADQSLDVHLEWLGIAGIEGSDITTTVKRSIDGYGSLATWQGAMDRVPHV